MASHVKRTIRLDSSQARTLQSIAERGGISQYAMLMKIIDAGFASAIGRADKDADVVAMAREIGSISERLAEAERVLDRTLFTACAAYAYARHAALGTRTSDETIASEVRAAFERQRSLALEDPS